MVDFYFHMDFIFYSEFFRLLFSCIDIEVMMMVIMLLLRLFIIVCFCCGKYYIITWYDNGESERKTKKGRVPPI